MIPFGPDDYPNIAEAWEVAPNVVRVATRNASSAVRITVERRLRAEGAPEFAATYEEELEVDLGDGSFALWSPADYPAAEADSLDECLRRALRHVDEGDGEAARGNGEVVLP